MRRTLLALVALCLLAPATASAATTSKPYYLALGDSYTEGVQGSPDGSVVIPSQSYPTQLLPKARKLLPGLKLEQAACGGATTTSMLDGSKVCGPPGPDRPYASTSPATSQMAYAEKFLRQHKGKVSFISITMGGNDLLQCVQNGVVDFNCIPQGIASVKANLPKVAKRLKKAARGTPILAAGYPDPFLEFYLRGDQGLAEASLGIQRSLNDAMEEVWSKYKIPFARVDDEFGTYTPFSQTAELNGQQVPRSVANICRYTWMCAPAPAGPNIHPTKAGYAIYANVMYRTLKETIAEN